MRSSPHPSEIIPEYLPPEERAERFRDSKEAFQEARVAAHQLQNEAARIESNIAKLKALVDQIAARLKYEPTTENADQYAAVQEELVALSEHYRELQNQANQEIERSNALANLLQALYPNFRPPKIEAPS